MGDVEVEIHFLLPVKPRIEIARGVQAERRVDGVVEEEVRLVHAVAGAGVPDHAVLQGLAQAGHHRRVADHPAELRREAARNGLLKGEAVRLREHLGQGRLVRPVVHDPHGGAVGGPVGDAVACVEHVADEQRLAVVEAVDVGAVVRVPEVEPLRHLLLRVVGVPVELHPVGEQVAEVAEQLQVVLDRRVAPDLRRVGHGRVAGRDQRRGVGALHAAIGRVGVAVLHAEIDETGVAERQSDVAGNGVRIAVARAVGAGIELQAAARAVVLEQEVQHAGNGVRAVLRRGAVAQHLHLAQRNRGNGRDVRTLRAVRHAGEPGDDRRAVAALAVHQHERVVVRQVAQAGRPHQRGGVADWMRGDVEGGDQRPQLVVERGGALADDVLQRNGVNGHRRGGHRPRPGAAAHDDDPLVDLHRHLHIEGGCGTCSDLHTRAHDLPEPGQREGDVVGAGLQTADRKSAGAVADGGPGCAAGCRAPRFHGHAGQDEAGGVGDGTGEAVLRVRWRRRQEEQGDDRPGKCAVCELWMQRHRLIPTQETRRGVRAYPNAPAIMRSASYMPTEPHP